VSGRRAELASGVGWAAAGGILHFLGFAGFGIWPLALVSLACLWHALEPERGTRAREAAALGALFGWVAFAGGYHWLGYGVHELVGDRVAPALLLWLGFSLWFAARFALLALAYTVLRRRGVPSAVAGPLPLLVIEAFYPDLFPVHVGAALVERVAWIQIADLAGPLGLSALVALANAALLETFRFARGRRAAPRALWLAAAGVALATWGYGALRIRALEAEIAAAPVLRIAVVQGGPEAKSRPGDPDALRRRYVAQTREALAAGGPVDLVIWPETIVTGGLRRPLPLSGRFVRDDLGVPLLFGAVSLDVLAGRSASYNSALLVGADGVIREAYDKNLLIPFGEYVPFAARAPALAARFAGADAFAAAHETPPLQLGTWRIATPICYEAIRPEFVRRMVKSGRPHLIVSLANDSWFGGSQEPWLHDAVARLRAVEHRRYLVRATNSGVSSVVDPVGRVVARSGSETRETVRAEVRMLEGVTLYGR
jgi:apolipoprotein N-acyltransferase